MNQVIAVAALLLAVGAAGLAGYALSQAPPAADDLAVRLDAVEDELSRVEVELGALREASRPPPSLIGLGPEGTPEATGVSERAPTASEATVAEGAPTGATPLAKDGEALEELVDAAVEKKAAQMQAMRNKKPDLATFASVLELTDDQQEVVAKHVVSSQAEIRSILEIPAEDGTVFLEEFVDAYAHAMAHPGKDKDRGKRLFARLVAEKVPGSDRTYAQQAEAVKARLRETYKRALSPKQYATFEAWQMDPTEIKDVPGSPWHELMGRIRERARALGAKLPDDEGPR